MSYQVSGESEVELKCLWFAEKGSSSGVPGLPFYRSREGPVVQEREREKEEREKQWRRHP
jgi:hypothetical protein